MMTKKMNVKVAVLIVSYNSRKDLPDCLNSLKKQDYPKDARTTLIIDNDSTDDSVEYVRLSHPGIHCIQNDSNIGFAEACNQGVRWAQKKKYDAIVLLNPDTIVEKEWLSCLIEGAYSDVTIAAAQSLIMLYPERHLINSAGNILHYLGFGYTNGYRMTQKEFFKGNNESVRDIAYPSGAAVLIKIGDLKESDLFQGQFFMYHEDLDLGWRLWLAGKRTVLVPQSIVFHKYSFKKSIQKYYYMERNRLYVLFTNYQLRTLFFLMPMLLITEIGLDISSVFNGYFKERYRALAYFFNAKAWKDIKKKRRQTARLRKITDREMILKHMSSEVYFQDVSGILLNVIANPLWRFYFYLVKRFI